VSKDKKPTLDEFAATEEASAIKELASAKAAPLAPVDTRKPIEFWAEELKTPKWLFAGLKLGKDWAIGQEVTRETYEEAADWAANVTCR
jgi:hypothetical protein